LHGLKKVENSTLFIVVTTGHHFVDLYACFGNKICFYVLGKYVYNYIICMVLILLHNPYNIFANASENVHISFI